MCFSRTETADEVVQPCPPKTENIIIIGSEQYYDSFWWKMIFITPGFSIAAGMKQPPYWQTADKTTVLYVSYGYVKAELLPIEWLKDNSAVNVQVINSISNLTSYLSNRNADEEEYKIRHLVFMAHGLHDKIALNFYSRPSINVEINQISAVKSDIFIPEGRIYSYACRTGVSVDNETFDNIEQAEPGNSLAQKMADHFGVKVHAYYTRTLFRNCIRDPSDSDSIAQSLKQKREEQEGQIIQISDEHEALPHEGLADEGWDLPGSWLDTGPRGEGTHNYALWRKAGARHLPTGANSPTGLPNTMQLFEPK